MNIVKKMHDIIMLKTYVDYQICVVYDVVWEVFFEIDRIKGL